jgi:hypothetical protein
MAGKEDLSNISKDQNARQSLDREPFLLQQEVGKRAYQLIKDFKQAIRSTPEFAQALQDKYFAEAQHDVFDMSIRANPDVHEFDWIEFEKGDYRYSVLYGTHSEEERLTVQKMPTKHERQGYENNFETVTLRAHINQESRQFDSGYIFHKKPDKVGTGIHNSTNKWTTIQKVENFLTTNFPNPQSQTPPQ